MRRFYILAIAAISAYCLTDAFASNGGGPARLTGTPTFSADLANLPIIQHETVGVEPTAASDTQAHSPVETVTAQPVVPPAPAAGLSAPNKARVAAAAPRVPHHRASKAEPAANEFTAPTSLTPTREPPIRVLAQRSSAPGGCSGAKWSQPDAAGVPVLVCD